MLITLGILTTIKLLGIVWVTCVCAVKEISLLHKYHLSINEQNQQDEEPNPNPEEPAEDMPLVAMQYRGLRQ